MSPWVQKVTALNQKSPGAYNFFMKKLIKGIRRAHPLFIWCPGPPNGLGTSHGQGFCQGAPLLHEPHQFESKSAQIIVKCHLQSEGRVSEGRIWTLPSIPLSMDNSAFYTMQFSSYWDEKESKCGLDQEKETFLILWALDCWDPGEEMSKDSQSIIFKYLKVSHIKDVNNFSGVFRMIEFKIMVRRSRVVP